MPHMPIHRPDDEKTTNKTSDRNQHRYGCRRAFAGRYDTCHGYTNRVINPSCSPFTLHTTREPFPSRLIIDHPAAKSDGQNQPDGERKERRGEVTARGTDADSSLYNRMRSRTRQQPGLCQTRAEMQLTRAYSCVRAMSFGVGPVHFHSTSYATSPLQPCLPSKAFALCWVNVWCRKALTPCSLRPLM